MRECRPRVESEREPAALVPDEHVRDAQRVVRYFGEREPGAPELDEHVRVADRVVRAIGE